MTNELLARIGLLEKENQKLKQVNEEHRILNGQLREEIKTKDKAYKAMVEELTEYAEENEKLKSQLAGTTFCYDEEEHRKLKEENEELKKQLEEIQKEYIEFQEKANDIQFELRDDRDNYYEKLCDVERDEKKFIKYLEDMLDDENDMFSVVRVKDVLQKYKEIVGDDK